jgi:hypothetical protein
MRKVLIIATVVVSGCVYSPKDDHSTHYHSPAQIKNKTDDDYIQQYVQKDNQKDDESKDTQFYDSGVTLDKTLKTNCTPVPHPVNRSIYFSER